MATTGFWPVRGNLKKVLDYADNPDKTTEKKYLDDDLYAALRYTENDNKTDERKYISGVNCSAENAYAEMLAVKRRFGERGKVIAYHGFQSFKTDELTPEECHAIGIETARRMWGKEYQVLVTTHLNTDNLHNHFVVNSVSFRNGKKYRNSIEQHYDLREVSDAICKEHGLSVLEDAPFHGEQKRKEYWKNRRDGQPTHREQLKADVEYCLRYSTDWPTFVQQLEAKGYSFDYTRFSVKAPNWQRAVRLNRLGITDDRMYEQWDRNDADPDFRYKYQNHKPHISTGGVLIQVITRVENDRTARLPLSILYEERSRQSNHTNDSRPPIERVMDRLIYEANHTHDTAIILSDAIFAIILALIELISHYTKEVILTAELRHELQHAAQFASDYSFLQENKLHSTADIDTAIHTTEQQIESLSVQREKLRNQIRHETDPKIKEENSTARASITMQIAPLRQRIKRLTRIRKDTPRLLNLLKAEMRREYEVKHPIREQQKQRTRNYEPER